MKAGLVLTIKRAAAEQSRKQIEGALAGREVIGLKDDDEDSSVSGETRLKRKKKANVQISVEEQLIDVQYGGLEPFKAYISGGAVLV